MFKMGSHDPFGYFKHKLWLKEGPRVKLAIWLPTIKHKESPQFPCMQVACDIPLESSWRWLNFALDLISIKCLYVKLWAPKVVGIPVVGISGLPLGSLETKWHLGAGPVARHKVYYKGEGGGFPQVRVVMSRVQVCPWLVLAPKVFQLCTNELVWFYAGSCEWVIACHSS